MKATSISAGSARRTATRDAVVFLHGHQLERNAARAAAAEAAGTFVLVLAITSAAVAAALARPVAGAPYGSLAVPVAGGLGLAIVVAGLGHISGAHLNPAVTLGLAVNRQYPWAYALVVRQRRGGRLDRAGEPVAARRQAPAGTRRQTARRRGRGDHRHADAGARAGLPGHGGPPRPHRGRHAHRHRHRQVLPGRPASGRSCPDRYAARPAAAPGSQGGTPWLPADS